MSGMALYITKTVVLATYILYSTYHRNLLPWVNTGHLGRNKPLRNGHRCVCVCPVRGGHTRGTGKEQRDGQGTEGQARNRGTG